MLAPAPRKAGQQIFSNVRVGKTLAQRGIDNPIESPQRCSRIVKIIDQLYLSCDDSFSEPGSGVVLAIDDDNSTDVSKEPLNVAMGKLDVSLSDDQKLSMLELAGSIKSGSLKLMSVEFSAVENDFCTAQMSDDNHDALLLAGQATHKQECKVFDTGASQNVEQDRSKFIVYFALRVPIPIKQAKVCFMLPAWVSSSTISVVMTTVCTVNLILRYTPRKRMLVCQSLAKLHFKT